jgi:S-adenosylmethionine decarboxylase
MDAPFPVEAAKDRAPSPELDVFEGPEKKLEIFFRPNAASDARGFRRHGKETWSDVLSDAHVTILHVVGNDEFDAYLLSESSLFVYPTKLILKTCGTTTLLLVLPKVLALADALGMPLANAHYSHFRYAFPQLQPYPHSSFGEEQRTMRELLEGRVADVSAKAIGSDAATGTAWFALAADGLVGPDDEKKQPTPPAEDCIFEVAMEGLSAKVCDGFFGTDAAHAGKTGRALANSMGELIGMNALVEGAVVDDWAFEPCGYSMNALNGPYYYTVHVTPEHAFSYASFETNDPAFAAADKLRDVATAFDPTSLTVTVTTRGGGKGVAVPELFDATSATAHASVQITREVSIHVCSFERAHTDAEFAAAKAAKTAAIAAVAAADGSGASSDEEQGSNAGSWAESDETASVDDGLDSPPAKYAKKMPAKEAADVSEPAAALSSVR